jgi:hypothetical protein
MPTVKSGCIGCKKNTPHELVKTVEITLPPGLSESYCVTCHTWKVVIAEEALAEPFFAPPPPRRKKRGSGDLLD